MAPLTTTQELLDNNQHLSSRDREKLKLWWEKVLRKKAGEEQVVDEHKDEAE